MQVNKHVTNIFSLKRDHSGMTTNVGRKCAMDGRMEGEFGLKGLGWRDERMREEGEKGREHTEGFGEGCDKVYSELTPLPCQRVQRST